MQYITNVLADALVVCQWCVGSRDFKNRGRGGSETRPEVTFPISDEKGMHVAFFPALENAAWRDLASSGKHEYLALLFRAKHYN